MYIKAMWHDQAVSILKRQMKLCGPLNGNFSTKSKSNVLIDLQTMFDLFSPCLFFFVPGLVGPSRFCVVVLWWGGWWCGFVGGISFLGALSNNQDHNLTLGHSNVQTCPAYEGGTHEILVTVTFVFLLTSRVQCVHHPVARLFTFISISGLWFYWCVVSGQPQGYGTLVTVSAIYYL